MKTSTQKAWRMSLGGMLVAALLAFSIVGIAWAAQPSLDQCANGSFSAPTTTCSWQSGNINENNSHYSEGDYVPFRLILPGLTVSNTYTATIAYDFIEASGKHAYDYIGTYNNTVTGANPCLGVTGCSSSTQAPIPTDTTCLNAQPPTQQFMTIFGGEITSVTRLGTHPCQGSAISVQYQIVFHASAVNVVLAWAGHIASQVDWGTGNGATGISGSPYHMRLISFCDPVCAGGNQDRSLAAAAVAAVTMTTQRNPAGSISANQNVFDVATLSGSISGAAPTGSVQFYICHVLNSDPTVFPTCSIPTDGTALGGPVTVITSTNTGTATSPNFNTSLLPGDAGGNYCFLAVYTSTSLIYRNVTDNITAANQTQECFFIGFPTAVTVDRFGANPSSEMVSTSNTLALGLAAVGVTVLGLLAFVIARKR